ncbi:MAG: YicC family protein [Deltaproteobacteria bacterium]|nr:YicC family protein [Deltaproteobacteria bacterium]
MRPMIKSMTGFGSATGEICGYSCRLEIKTLNARFKEFILRSPHLLTQLEESLKKQIGLRVHRGRVELWITVEEDARSRGLATLNMELAEDVYKKLLTLKERLGLEEPVTLQHLLPFNVISLDKSFETSPAGNDELLAGVRELNQTALSQLMDMRESEGRQLHEDLQSRLDSMAQWLEELKKLAANLPAAATKRYQARLEELAETIIDPSRLTQEAAIMAERIDVTEEMTRFGSHIQGFRALLDADGPVGRRLEFMLQEMNREVNTMGSKCQAKSIIDLVLKLKAELEKIREQSLNIE